MSQHLVTIERALSKVHGSFVCVLAYSADHQDSGVPGASSYHVDRSGLGSKAEKAAYSDFQLS